MSTPFVVAVTRGGFIAQGFRTSCFGNHVFFRAFRKCPAVVVAASLRKVFGKVLFGNPFFFVCGFSKLPGQPGNSVTNLGECFFWGISRWAEQFRRKLRGRYASFCDTFCYCCCCWCFIAQGLRQRLFGNPVFWLFKNSQLAGQLQ